MLAPTIVLVDDDPDKRFLLKRLFQKNFPENDVTEFGSCDEAASWLSTDGPKVVVTNGRIASESGLDFAFYSTHLKHLPVVMISLREELRQKALDAGVLAFVETGDNAEVCRSVGLALRMAPALKSEHE